MYGWYLYTSNEHYWAHVCRVKKTNTERVSDTVVFQNKTITNPTITHADRVVHVIKSLETSMKGLVNGKSDRSMRDLAEISAASMTVIHRHAFKGHQPAQITLQDLSVQTPRVLAPLYKAHQPPRVATNVPCMQKSIKLTHLPRVEQIIVPPNLRGWTIIVQHS